MYITYHQALADRRIAIALFVSIALHVAFMFAPPLKRNEQESAMSAASPPPLNVRIVQSKPPPAELVERFEPVEVPRAIPVPKRTPAIKPKTPEPVDAPKAEEVPPAPVPTPEPTPLAPPFDMAALIAANRERRRSAEAGAARGPSSPAEPSPDQVAMANINRNLQSITKGGEGTSGVFEILYKGHQTATFAFNGWKTDARRTWREVIEVDAGQGGDIELAIVRRMIVLIRQHYVGDFNWESHRFGRVVVLSARPADTAGLEEFMVREFFGSPNQRSMR
jgi:hypothetical protein